MSWLWGAMFEIAQKVCSTEIAHGRGRRRAFYTIQSRRSYMRRYQKHGQSSESDGAQRLLESAPCRRRRRRALAPAEDSDQVIWAYRRKRYWDESDLTCMVRMHGHAICLQSRHCMVATCAKAVCKMLRADTSTVSVRLTHLSNHTAYTFHWPVF